MILKKICLLGDFAVGKTSLVRRFVDREFSDQYLSTVGVKISRRLLDYSTPESRGRELQMVIWDIEGSSQFKGVPMTYIHGAHGAVVVGDLTRDDTLQHVEQHLAQFIEANPSAYVVVALNKADLAAGQPSGNFSAKFKSQVLGEMCTSARTGNGVDYLFDVLGRQFLTA